MSSGRPTGTKACDGYDVSTGTGIKASDSYSVGISGGRPSGTKASDGSSVGRRKGKDLMGPLVVKRACALPVVYF